MNELDVRGLSCPEPMLRTQQVLKKEGTPLRVLVDDPCAEGNIGKLVKSLKKTMTVNKLEGSDLEIVIE